MDLPGGTRSTFVGIACGAGAAVFWATGFVAARHGIDIGLSPADLTLHRCFWAGLVLLPLAWRDGIADLGGIGWGRAVLLAILAGPGLAMVSMSGFLLVPLGHGGVIQPSCAALIGLLLAIVVLKERLPRQRAFGAITIVGGLAVIGSEALTTIGAHGIVGDLTFALAGSMFATFGMLLRLWRIAATRATVAVSVVSLAVLPIHWALTGFERMAAAGIWDNLLQMVVQGILAGPLSIFLYVRSVALLGAGRAAVFPSLVPGFTLLIGFLVLGEVPSAFQLAGFAIVLIGFRLAQRG